MKGIVKKLLAILLGLIFGFLLFIIGFELYLKQTGNFGLQRFCIPHEAESGFTHHMRHTNKYKVSKYPGLGWEIDFPMRHRS